MKKKTIGKKNKELKPFDGLSIIAPRTCQSRSTEGVDEEAGEKDADPSSKGTKAIARTTRALLQDLSHEGEEKKGEKREGEEGLRVKELGQQTRRLRTKGRRGKLSRCHPTIAGLISKDTAAPSTRHVNSLVRWETQRSESSERLGQLLDRRGAAAWYRGILEHIPLAQWQSAAGGSCSPQTSRMQGMYYSTPCSTYLLGGGGSSLSVYRPPPNAQLLLCIYERQARVLCHFPYCNSIPLWQTRVSLLPNSYISPPTWCPLSNITGRLPAVGTAHCSGLCCLEEPLSDPESLIAYSNKH